MPHTKDINKALMLYRKRQVRDSKRMQEIQEWCVAELKRRGLKDAEIEKAVEGAYRTKNWDVAYVPKTGAPIFISTKTIDRNLGGSVPNRLDDMLGEAADLHRKYPNAVIGYLGFMNLNDGSEKWQSRIRACIKDIAKLDELLLQREVHGKTWFKKWDEGLKRIPTREDEDTLHEAWEASHVQLIDWGSGIPKIVDHGGSVDDISKFFDTLVNMQAKRSTHQVSNCQIPAL